jgi:hypothetical protein
MHCMGYVGLSRGVQTRTWNEAAIVRGIYLGTISSVHTLPWGSLTLWHMSTFVHPFLSQFTTSNFSSVLIVFHWFSTWIALGDEYVDLLLILVTKAVERGTTSAEWLYHQYIHMTEGLQWPSAHLQHKTIAATDRLCQIMLNRRLLRIVCVKLCKFEKWCKFFSHVKVKSC